MDLEQFADLLVGKYSGGNKRKLSVAIAMLGKKITKNIFCYCFTHY